MGNVMLYREILVIIINFHSFTTIFIVLKKEYVNLNFSVVHLGYIVLTINRKGKKATKQNQEKKSYSKDIEYIKRQNAQSSKHI